MAIFLTYTNLSDGKGMINSENIVEVTAAGEYTQVTFKRINPIGETELEEIIIKEKFDEVYKQLHPND